MAITPEKRKQIEELIYTVMDKLDKTGSNSNYYKELFSGMSDNQFYNYMKKDFPFRFHVKPFEIDPSMEDINNACKALKVPLLEKVYLPYLYKNKDGKAVNTKECLVGYIPLKKMKQFITKKNAMSTDISERDMKTGLLVSFDKNGTTSDREMEALAVMSLDKTMKELSRPRADSMNAKSIMYSTINTLGQVSLADVPIDIDDSLGKNLLNVYLVGSLLNSNLINQDYYLPYTLKNKQRKVEREV